MTDLAPLRDFVIAVTRLLSDQPTERALLPVVADHLRRLVASDTWLPDAWSTASSEQYCQYLLHCDPLERFCVVSFVWGPGQSTPIHDHRTWGVIGMLRGRERSTRYQRDRNTGRLIEGETKELLTGDIEFVSPRLGDIHRVCNAQDREPSISVHVYGANIGAVKRHLFDPQTGAPGEFISGYTSASVPNLWDRSG